jgi:hypothetical protein
MRNAECGILPSAVPIVAGHEGASRPFFAFIVFFSGPAGEPALPCPREGRERRGERRKERGERREEKGERREEKGERREEKGERREGKGERREGKGERRKGKGERREE